MFLPAYFTEYDVFLTVRAFGWCIHDQTVIVVCLCASQGIEALSSFRLFLTIQADEKQAQ